MSIDSTKLLRFLRSRGWTVSEQPNRRLTLLESPRTADGDFTSVVVPRDMSFADSTVRIHQALLEIADFVAEEPNVLLRRIERWDLDFINTRLFRRNEPTNSIPLPLATLVVDDLKAFVGYAAHNQVSPSKYFPKAGRVASDFSHHCRFGHTFEGSFGIRIECPLPNVGQLSFTEELREPPFERLVTQRIARGYSLLRLAVESADPAPLLNGYQTGMNANMLRALTDIYENLDSFQVEYAVDWSPELSPPGDLRASSPVRFDGRAHELARYVVDELEREDDQDQTTVTSHVVSLKSEMPLEDGVQDEFDHEITLDWEKERSVFVRIHVILPAGEYKKACDAHKTGRRVQVSGVPKKEGKIWYLFGPSEIRFPT